MYIELFMTTQKDFTFVEKKNSDDNVKRLKKTISNIGAAEVVKEFAEGAEVKLTKKNKSRINGDI